MVSGCCLKHLKFVNKMDFTSLLPQIKNICRTCLSETGVLMNLDDFVEYEINKVKLFDILEFLGCIEKIHDENWPQGMCEICITNAFTAYCFKVSCLKANSTLSEVLIIQSSASSLQQSEMDAIDINVVHQDHEYDVPLFNSTSMLDIEPSLTLNRSTPQPIEIVETVQQAVKISRTESEKKFSCTICSQSFTRIYGLRDHMEIHTGVSKYLCQKCGKSFRTVGSLRQHSLSHENRIRYKCASCDNSYKSRQSLRVHNRVAHTDDRNLYSCTICNKTFTVKCTLLSHMKVHTGLKEFACPDCPKTYTRAVYLRNHRLTHTGQKVKPYSCDKKNCVRTFSTKYSL